MAMRVLLLLRRLPLLLLLLLSGAWCGAGVVGVAGAAEEGWGRAPVLVLEPPSLAFLTNTSGATLRCAALGNPPPALAWLDAAGHPLQPKPRLREVLGDGSLWLAPVVPGSSHAVAPRATYRCRATNPSGTVISRATTVSTLSPSVVSVRAEGRRGMVGGVGVVRCVVGGSGGEGWVVKTWLRKDQAASTSSSSSSSSTSAGVPLPDAGRYVYGSGGRLYVQDLTLEDAHASFTCSVRHPASLTSLTSPPTTLTVLAAPTREAAPRMEEKDPRMVEVVEGRPWTLSCLAHGHPPPHYRNSRPGHACRTPPHT